VSVDHWMIEILEKPGSFFSWFNLEECKLAIGEQVVID